MTIKKRILIPLDGSPFSLQILESVQEFLPPSENKLILLRVEADTMGLVAGPAQPTVGAGVGYTPIYSSHQDALRAHHPIYATQEEESKSAEVRNTLQQIMDFLEDAGYEVDWAVRFGEPVEEIVNYIDSIPVDMVAMTTHGRTGLSRLIFGSVASELVRRLRVPILLLRPIRKS
ncbi:MAG: universal stress protein [Caldilineaceae bacterium]|nr:universal stress protein [Caldilineaceae bacterium]